MDASDKQVDQRHHHLAVSQILSESVVDSTHMFGFSNHAALPNDISAVLFSVCNAHLIKAGIVPTPYLFQAKLHILILD